VQFDDLDLAWDDADRQPRHRHRRANKRDEARQTRSRRERGSGRGGSGKNGSGKGRGARTAIALVLSLLVLGGLGGGIWYGAGRIQAFFNAPDYATGGSGEVIIEVRDGQSATDIGETLAGKDVVKSSKAFANAAEKDTRSRGLAPGTYRLRLKMRASDALSLLLDPASRLTNGVTLAEGKIAREMFTILSEKTGIPFAEFETAAKDPVALGIPESWFARDDGKPVTRSVEGFLFPATYEIPENPTAAALLKMMVAKFNEIATKLDFVNRARSQGKISPYEALITASITEVEAPYAKDRAKVARVIYNRLYGENFPSHELEMDSAVNYWLKSQGQDSKHSNQLDDSELHNKDNPYNTHDVAGLPPGPISNPGEGSMIAALEPDSDKEILFFVTIDKEGNTAFARTNAEHEANIATAKKNGAM
jgi:UPF0755 protein